MEINGVAFKEPGTGGTNAEQTLANTFDTFLALLTTQLKNQDPLDPMNSEEFTQQLVQFAGVEQTINSNKKLDQLVQLQTSGLLNGAVSFIGKDVEVLSDQLLLKDATATITYGLEGNSEKTVINIVDGNGSIVRTYNGETTNGRHTLVWNGLGNNGQSLPDGVYGFTVTAVDKADKTVPTVAATIGHVTGLEILDGKVTLNIGELGVPFDAIFAVRNTSPES